MADERYFCPDCGCIDIITKDAPLVLSQDGSSALTHTCPNCGWEGSEEDTLGAYTSEKLWGIEEYAEALLRVLAIHATAPMIQLLEFQGLIPREAEAETPEELEKAHAAKDHVMKAVFQAAATAAFTAALESRDAAEATV